VTDCGIEVLGMGLLDDDMSLTLDDDDIYTGHGLSLLWVGIAPHPWSLLGAISCVGVIDDLRGFLSRGRDFCRDERAGVKSNDTV